MTDRPPTPAPGTPGRFVLLRHECGPANGGPAASHWDLMIDLPGADALATWQVRTEPAQWGRHISAVRIADHRKAYLAYEGEVSGGRGRVTRVDAGPARVVEQGDVWRVALYGAVTRGEFWLGPTPSRQED